LGNASLLAKYGHGLKGYREYNSKVAPIALILSAFLQRRLASQDAVVVFGI